MMAAAIVAASIQQDTRVMSPDVPAATGGTLSEFADYFKSTAQPHCLSTPDQLWVPGSRGELIRKPVHCTAPVEEHESQKILQVPGTRVLTSLRVVSETRPANCILYLCRGEPYGMERISRNARKVIRRGLRNFECRRCTWDELANYGYAALVETDKRHGYAIRSREEFDDFVNRHRAGAAFFEVWGAWHDADTLAGWVLLSKVDDVATFLKVCSLTQFMSKAPNNVLHYLPMETLINDEKRRYVSTGFSSIQPGAEMGLHEFKVRLGFDAIPVHRTYIVPRHIRPFIMSPLTSRFWDASAKLLPKYSILRKISGMSQVLSGRQADPLAWVPDLQDISL